MVEKKTVKRILTSHLTKTGVDYAIGLNRKNINISFQKQSIGVHVWE